MYDDAISVIVPAYNAEAYLGEAIRSILQQTVLPLEILIVDDGSTDGTAALASSFGTPVKVLQQPNRGVSSARNLGIHTARHPWLAFLDADDLMPPDRLEIQQRLFVQDPTLQIALGQQQFFSHENCAQIRARYKDSAQSQENTNIRLAIVPGALFCRATVFQEVGLFDPQRQAAEFIVWFTEAMRRGIRYAVAAQVVLYRRIHADNLSRQRVRNSDEYPQALKAILDRKRAALRTAKPPSPDHGLHR